MAFFTWLSTFVVNLVKAPLTYISAYFLGKREGKREQQLETKVEQQDKDLDAIARAEAARRAVKHDDRSVRDDPFNRDNDV